MGEALRWDNLLVSSRFRVDENGVCSELGGRETDNRTEFTKDADRIVFSNAFRRLSKKTQVHPLAMNDHVHNRLTHSLEVGSVGRSLGIGVGYCLEERNLLPAFFNAHQIGEIVQAACLAHDIGNPPFGHAGEAALQNWFRNPDHHKYVGDLPQPVKSDFKIFDGNAQSFRIVTVLENNKGTGGMRLTYSTLAAMVKYPVTSYRAEENGKEKFGFYRSEERIFLHVAQRLGLGDEINHIRRHPLSFLTEAADDICYSLIDLEDAHEMGILRLDDIFDAVAPVFDGKTQAEVLNKTSYSDRRKIGYLRSSVISILVRDGISAFMEHHDRIMEGVTPPDLISLMPDRSREAIEQAKTLARSRVFKEKRKVTLEIGAYRVFERLLDVFIPAVYERVTSNAAGSFRTSRVIDLLGVNAPQADDDLYRSYLAVVDFISGMTDDYATFISSQFSGSGR